MKAVIDPIPGLVGNLPLRYLSGGDYSLNGVLRHRKMLGRKGTSRSSG